MLPTNASHPGYALLYILLELTSFCPDNLFAKVIEIACLHLMCVIAINKFNHDKPTFLSLQQIREERAGEALKPIHTTQRRYDRLLIMLGEIKLSQE